MSFLGFEPIEQPRDSGRLLDHPLRNVQRRHAFVAGTAENPQDVVLLEGDTVRLHQRGHLPPHQIGGAHQGDHGFVGHRLERPTLANLLLQCADSHATPDRLPVNS